METGSQYTGEDFSGALFLDVGAKACKFTDCIFDHVTFDRSYFRNATFTNCKFRGARFRDSSFRGARFKGRCEFEYATFVGTLIPVHEMLENQPPYANLKLEFARSLRANYSGLGMHREAQEFFAVELLAEVEDYAKILAGSEPYYKEKYPSFWSRLPFRWRKLRHRVEDFAWGHGASPLRLARTTGLGLLILATAFLILGKDFGGRDFFDDPVGAVGDAAYYTLLTFFSATHFFTLKSALAKVLTVATLLWGYLTLGLFAAAMYRRLART